VSALRSGQSSFRARLSAMQLFIFAGDGWPDYRLLQENNLLDCASSACSRPSVRSWHCSSSSCSLEFHDGLPGSLETRKSLTRSSGGSWTRHSPQVNRPRLREPGAEFVQFSVALAGSHSAGRLYAVANSIHQNLEFSRLSFLLAVRTQYIDLTSAPQRLRLPPVPTKKVYLIPVGLATGEPLDWAPAYYKAKFDIDASVLPAVPLPEKFVNPRRRQVDSEGCVEYLRKLHPELDADPSALLIGVTSRDIYIASFNWTYAENYRQGARFAVVSSAQLHPPEIMSRWNPEWLHSRLQKMLTKNIVMPYFDLPMSSDYTSLLSGGVLSGPQVDFMGGTIIGAEGKWGPFIDKYGPAVTVYAVPGKPPLWRMTDSDEALPQRGAHSFRADLDNGLFIDRTADFRLEGEYPLVFTRSYRNPG
jgi:hypothetical protein